jgi:hypothetical protein
MTKNWKKIQLKLFFISKIAINLSLGLLKGRPSYRRSAFRTEHPALQKMKFMNHFLFLWAIFALLDPGPDTDTGPDTDPATPLNPDPIRIHNTAFLLEFC